MKKFLALSALSLAAVIPSAFASPMTLSPGTNGQTPDTLAVGASATLLTSQSGTITAPTITGNYTEWVYADPSNTFCANCLDFVIQVQDTAGSIERITSSSFMGFNVAAGYTAGSGVAPMSVDRIGAGDVVGFNYPGANSLPLNSTTDRLVIETNAQSYVPGYLSIQDGTSNFAIAFAPAPEPVSMSLLGGGLLGIGLLRLRRRKPATN